MLRQLKTSGTYVICKIAEIMSGMKISATLLSRNTASTSLTQSRFSKPIISVYPAEVISKLEKSRSDI